MAYLRGIIVWTRLVPPRQAASRTLDSRLAIVRPDVPLLNYDDAVPFIERKGGVEQLAADGEGGGRDGDANGHSENADEGEPRSAGQHPRSQLEIESTTFLCSCPCLLGARVAARRESKWRTRRVFFSSVICSGGGRLTPTDGRRARSLFRPCRTPSAARWFPFRRRG